jgi:hypothetical protein
MLMGGEFSRRDRRAAPSRFRDSICANMWPPSPAYSGPPLPLFEALRHKGRWAKRVSKSSSCPPFILGSLSSTRMRAYCVRRDGRARAR